MSIRAKLNRSLGLEDDAPTVEINVDVDEAGVPLDGVDLEGNPTPEVDEAEMLEAAAEIEDGSDEIDELEEAQATLESLSTLMREDYQNGGMSPQSARFAAIAVESISLKYGITAQEVGISLESVSNDRNAGTIVSMEGVRDFISNIVRSIIEKVKELMKKIADFYQRNLSGAAGLKRRAEALKKKARNTTGTKMKETKLEDKGLFARLNVQGNAPTVSEITGVIKGLTGAYKQGKVDSEEVEKEVQKILTGAAYESDDSLESVMKVLLGSLTSGKGPFGSVGGSKSATNFEIGGSSSATFAGEYGLPGNKAVGIGYAADSNSTSLQKVGRLQAGVFTDNSKYKAANSKPLPALSLTDCENICDAVIDNMAAYITNAQKKNTGVNFIKTMESSGKKIIDDLDRESTEDAAKQQRATKLLNSCLHTYRVTIGGESQLLTYNMTLCKASLSYAARSINNFEKA